MDFIDISKRRVTTRQFAPIPVEQEKLNLLLEAGRNAPTAHNNQPQRIFVFRSPEALEKADACMDCHFHAPVVIGVGYDPKESWHREQYRNNRAYTRYKIKQKRKQRKQQGQFYFEHQ